MKGSWGLFTFFGPHNLSIDKFYAVQKYRWTDFEATIVKEVGRVSK